MSNPHINAEEMVRLYVEEEWSVRDIATRFGYSYGRTYGILRSRVVLRTSGGKGPRRTTEYIKIAETMREHIITGEWPPGHKILTQQQLALIFNARHQTIREAIAHLRQHGYLTTTPNKGTYVRPPQNWEPAISPRTGPKDLRSDRPR
jgi:Bacterial regulatory proteins, gntR family